jgi:hypothetical protein
LSYFKQYLTVRLLFCSCFWLLSTDYLERIPVIHALGYSHSCWWRVCPGRWLWGNTTCIRYLTVNQHVQKKETKTSKLWAYSTLPYYSNDADFNSHAIFISHSWGKFIVQEFLQAISINLVFMVFQHVKRKNAKKIKILNTWIIVLED